jgi:hypothetical protein
MAVAMNGTILCDVMPYNLVEAYRRFGGNYFHLRGRRSKPSSKKREPVMQSLIQILASKEIPVSLLGVRFANPEHGGIKFL